MSIFNFWKKEDKKQTNLQYSEYLISNPEFDPTPIIIDPEYSWGMPSGNPIVLGHRHWSEFDCYSSTGTVAISHPYSGYSYIKCDYCGRRNRDTNEFCAGCGANL